MAVTRTVGAEPGTDFRVEIPITKAYVDKATGKRHIVGVASGIAVDQDKERCSRNAIVKMARKAATGVVKLTSSHQQDWMTEIGDVVKADHDAQTDELVVDTILPAEGVDPLADKAWRVANTEKVGFSIGGKLEKSYFERDETGKKRKVLDAIDLRHIMLTKNPSYAASFAQAVAKTWTGDAPADDEFTLDADDDVEKDTTGGWQSGSSEGGNGGRDSVGSGQRNAGSRKPDQKGMDTEDDGTEDEQSEDLPKAKDERHLACPNCGHEFAADLPVDPDEQQPDDSNDNDNSDEDEDRDTTGKSRENTPPMSKLTETLDSLRALAAAEDVTKTDTPAGDSADVAKATTGSDLEVAKLVAASHHATEERLAKLEETLGEAFGLIAKSHQALRAQFAELPLGRKSTARILPPPNGHADGGAVEKTIDELVAETDDPIEALKLQNAAAGWTGR